MGNKFSHSRPVNPRVVAHRNPGWQLVLGHLAPDLRYAVYEAAEDRPEYAGEATIYIATPDGSWALAEYTLAGAPYGTERAGTRNLRGEVGAAWDAWCTTGRPSRGQLGVTVDVTGTHPWIAKPSASRSLKS
jgi:protein-L-isoaspartate(D-aspartate) O-methyltransferase